MPPTTNEVLRDVTTSPGGTLGTAPPRSPPNPPRRRSERLAFAYSAQPLARDKRSIFRARGRAHAQPRGGRACRGPPRGWIERLNSRGSRECQGGRHKDELAEPIRLPVKGSTGHGCHQGDIKRNCLVICPHSASGTLKESNPFCKRRFALSYQTAGLSQRRR